MSLFSSFHDVWISHKLTVRKVTSEKNQPINGQMCAKLY